MNRLNSQLSSGGLQLPTFVAAGKKVAKKAKKKAKKASKAC